MRPTRRSVLAKRTYYEPNVWIEGSDCKKVTRRDHSEHAATFPLDISAPTWSGRAPDPQYNPTPPPLLRVFVRSVFVCGCGALFVCVCVGAPRSAPSSLCLHGTCGRASCRDAQFNVNVNVKYNPTCTCTGAWLLVTSTCTVLSNRTSPFRVLFQSYRTRKVPKFVLNLFQWIQSLPLCRYLSPQRGRQWGPGAVASECSV